MIDFKKNKITPNEKWQCIEYNKLSNNGLQYLNKRNINEHQRFLHMIENDTSDEMFKSDTVEFYRCTSEDIKLLSCYNYIYSDTYKYIYIAICSYVPICLWVNDEIVYCYDFFYPSLLKVKMHQGVNVFLLETTAYKKDEVLRIEMFADDSKIMNEHSFINSLKSNYLIDEHHILFHYPRKDFTNERMIDFLCLPVDREQTDFHRGITVEIYPYIHLCADICPYLSDKLLKKSTYEFGKWSQIDLNELRYKCDKDTYAIQILIKYNLDDGTIKSRHEEIVINNGKKYIDYAIQRTDDLLDSQILNEYDRYHLEYYKELLPSSFWYADMVMKAVSLIATGKSVTDEYSNNIIQREKRLIFDSELDNSLEIITYILPENHDKNTKYPLLIICSAYYHDSQSYNFLEMNDCIVADISGRGILTGSYQNEAQFFDSIKHLFKFCSVDYSRIYLTGFSNGAYDVWSFAENYPYLFSGIYLVTGCTIKEKIGNLSTMRVITISSPEDYLYDEAYEYPIEMLSKYGNITGIELDNLNHSILFVCMFNKQVYDELFKCQSIQKPKISDFKINVKNRKLGIASIYLRPLTVCAKPEYFEIAENFSIPSHNGYDHIVHIKYPIKDEIDNKDINGSVIFINTSCGYQYIFDAFPVKCDINGFCYLGKMYIGEYSVLQIISNPKNSNEFYLSINISSRSEQRKNILLRKFILSSYSNGFNPFINNDILIHYNKKYFTAAKSGDKLKEIDSI